MTESNATNSSTSPTPDNATSSGDNSGSNSNSSNNNNNQRSGNRGNNGYRNRNPRRTFRTNNTDNLRNFKGAIESIPVLGTKVEKTSQDFSKFTKAIHNHVLANFTYPKDISFAITDFKDPIRIVATDLPTKGKLMSENFIELKDEQVGTDEEKQEAIKHNEDIKETIDGMRKAAFVEYNKRKTAASSNMAALWGIVMGQCSGSLQQHVKAEEEYESHMYDAVWLLQTLKRVISGVTQQSNVYHLTFHALKDLYKMRQKYDETVEEYFCRFEAAIDLVHLSHDTRVFDNAGLLALEQADDGNITSTDIDQRFLAMIFIENACTAIYTALWTELTNSVATKTDKYPKTLSEATYLLTHWKSPVNIQHSNNRNGTSNQNTQSQLQLSFYQRTGEPLLCQEITNNKNADGTVKGTDGETVAHDVTCHNCGFKGHYAPKCPAPRQRTYHFGFAQSYHFIFQQSQHLGGLSPTVLILDTGSTFNSFFNRRLLEDIQLCDEIRAYSNGGYMDYFEDGVVSVLPALSAYYNPDSLANILSLSEVAQFYRVIMDTERSNSITVILSDLLYITFDKAGQGLYAYDTAVKPKAVSESPHFCMFTTVAANKDSYSLAEVQGAETARQLQARIGWPSDAQFKDALTTPGTLYNCATTSDDVTRAHDITGGMAHQLLKGKSVRRKKKLFHDIPRINIEAPLLAKDRFDDLDVDFMYVQGKPYLLTSSRKIIFQTMQSFNRISKIAKNKKITYRRGKKDIIEGLNKVIKLYTDIETLHADGEFRKVENSVNTTVECCAADEHVDRIERQIRVVKERTRCYWISLPYRKAPKVMIDENLFDINEWLNAYPYKHGISNKYSPAAIMQGKGPVDVSTLRVTFGAYCEVYNGTDNMNKERKVSCIALRPCNRKGGYYFLSLETGRKIHGHDWTELAIPQRVIDRVHELADEENTPALDDEGCPVFEIDAGIPLTIEEDDDENVRNEAEQDANDADEDDGTANNDDPESDDNDESNTSAHDDDDSTDDDDSDYAPSEGDDVSLGDDDDKSTTSDGNEDTPGNTENTNTENTRSGNNDSGNIRESRSDGDGNERPRRAPRPPSRYEPTMEGKSYPSKGTTLFQDVAPPPVSTCSRQRMYSQAVNVIFNQMHASKGIKLFKEKAAAAIFKEYKQLNDMCVLGRIYHDSLTEEQKRLALDAVNLIKEKRDGHIKGRTCANGSTQRSYIPREEASSPTVSLEALLSLFIIFAYEKRATAVFDVPGAYLHADIPEGKFALLKITGQFVDIVCDVNPEFRKDVRYEHGRKVLYIQILKAIYGMIESALLWYELYVTVLLDEGYELNPYDKCVANKVINGKQYTIGWYVDDNIVGHKGIKVIDDLIGKIDARFPGLVVQKGPKVDFLGMELMFRDDGKVDIGTVQFLKKMAEEFEEDTGMELTRSYSTPAASWLFKIKEAKQLCPKFTSYFRKYVMKTLWVSKRSRPDLETAMGFLTTRVQVPTTKDHWHKLTRMMSFVKDTAEDVRTIGVDNLHHLLTLIDSAHAVHAKNMRGHTGSVSTMGTGVLDTKSSKQKMNTRSSTETEFVGTSEALPKSIYRCHFMEGQGYKIKWNVLGKDNKSEIKLLKNGRDSCTWNSKHIAIKYFWVTDRVTDEKIIVEHCPTNQMLGSLFKTFRDALMGWKHIGELFKVNICPGERVENSTVSSPSYAPEGNLKMQRGSGSLQRKLYLTRINRYYKRSNSISLNKKNLISNNVFKIYFDFT